MFHKILIGSDGSVSSRNAALLASEIARRFDSETIVVNAFDISFTGAFEIGTCSLSASSDIIEKSMQSELAAAENAVKPLLAPLQPPYRMIQELGHPADVLLAVAEREHADLIVVGGRGLRQMKEFLLGSVSHCVLHHAHCPVLIERGQLRLFQRLLLACDGSAEARKAADAAFALAKGFDACVDVLNVEEPSGWFGREGHDPHPVKIPEEVQQRERRCPAVHASVEAAAKETSVPFHICEERGHAGEAIVRYAEKGRYDLIVMGRRGLGSFERLLVGSVSNYVASHACSPVLVVR
ncbi:MAG: Universal stress protein UspA and related nucleotide-binding protein [Chthonomonadaceae bacterium]|nr:Universal stress protein UspA and related nucleotide-binding protein [Chthonomonadaceae bacterium]